MSSALLAGAFVLGFAGSAHCVAMCGGIAGALGLATPAGAKASGRPIVQALAYNGGRVASYAIAGALAGTVGLGIVTLPHADALRAALVVFAGALMIASGVKLARGGRGLRWLEDAGVRFWRVLSPLARHLFPIRTVPKAFAAGMLWGFLPCGMVYGALTLAAASAGPLLGAATMLAFGLGTVPALAAVSIVGPAIGQSRFAVARRFAGVALVAIGVAAIAVQAMPMHHHPAAVDAPGARAPAAAAGHAHGAHGHHGG